MTQPRPCASHDVVDCAICAVERKNLVRVLNEMRAKLAPDHPRRARIETAIERLSR
jgi:hypothetical protein